MEDFYRLLKTSKNVKNEVIQSFAIDLADEINKLIEKYGKEELRRRIDEDLE